MSLINIASLFSGVVDDFLKRHRAASYILLLLLSLGGFFIDFKKADDDSLRSVIKELRINEQNIKQELLENKLDLDKLKNELFNMKLRYITLESSMEESPFPTWIKSTGTREKPGIMLYLNKSYDKLYLKPIDKNRADYIGKTDIEFWGKSLGHIYWQNDLYVLSSGQMTEFMAPHPLNNLDSLRVVKYIRTLNGTVIGIAGIVIPK